MVEKLKPADRTAALRRLAQWRKVRGRDAITDRKSVV